MHEDLLIQTRSTFRSAMKLESLANSRWLRPGPRPTGKPNGLNIVCLPADDLGWSELNRHGGDPHKTTNLDRLAVQGRRLTDAFVAAPEGSAALVDKVKFGKWPRQSRTSGRNRFSIYENTAGKKTKNHS